MARRVGTLQAKTHLSALLDRVERGEEVVITRHGKPVARLAPIAEAAAQAALWKDIFARLDRFRFRLAPDETIKDLIAAGRK